MMGLFNYVKAKSKFKNNAFVLETIERIADFDEFHCLRDSNLLLAEKVFSIIKHPPKEYIEWMTVCRGGYLFDTELLSVDAVDEQLDIAFSSLQEANEEECLKELSLPAGYAVIGLRSYGDPICVSQEEGDAKIYLWDCEEQSFTDIWDTFYDFLAEEVDTAIEIIANGDMEPIPFKIQEGDD